MCYYNKIGWGENGLVDSLFIIFEYKRSVDIKEKMGFFFFFRIYLFIYMYVVVYSNVYLGLLDFIGNVTGFFVWNFTI